ncbi:FAD-dependent monooxygenase [Streptomyces sp. NPDC099050]|uniref:FAD-dependent monooxygenase n=1 Tax=Streptomyces sp. NPDC099050 TaxID=3366100 RepID=UPI003813ADDD
MPGSSTRSAPSGPTSRAAPLFASEPLANDRHDVAQQKKLLAEAYAGGSWEVPRLLAALDRAPDFYFDSLSQAHLDHWSKGRTVLVGDAAYCASPASGEGTILALVGAYVLAGELAAAGGDHRTGFAAYEREMRRFAEENQKLGPSNIKHMVMRTKRQISIQLTLLSLLDLLPGKERMVNKVMEPIQKVANSITLKDY